MLFTDSNDYVRLAPLDSENRSVGVSGVSHNTIFSKGKGELISGKPAQAVNKSSYQVTLELY